MDRSPYREAMEAAFRDRTGRELEDFVADRIAEGASWRRIEREVFSASDGAASVSNVSLARWYGETKAA